MDNLRCKIPRIIGDMANLLPFFPSAAFDHNATRAMGKAFDRACHSLHDIGQPDLLREIIANEIKDYGEKKYT